ncbi:SDR family NAD(P)-dependent oxidoreductase [Terasakiella sp.]|uniref:SDR family NAD(P)-dependent oxidoreductase n=1 Tax=Terasakiella sp. TaxID=2034861 RepID=UPI003AA90840
MDWKNKNIFVTGAAGFIGSHLCETLTQKGANVTAFVHYNSLNRFGWLDYSRLKNDMEIVLGDITDSNYIDQLIKEKDTVFHLAALIGIPYSYVAPDSYIQTNIIGTTNVLKAVRRHQNRRLIHTSTSEVYGTAQFVPIDESHPLQGQSPYSASKIGADMMAESYYRSFDVPVTIVRPFNTFGPRQSMRAVIPTIISQCLRNQPIQLGNVTPTRDMNYVSNTVAGFIMAAECNDAIGETINLGSGREISIGDLAKLIIQLCGNDNPLEEDLTRTRPKNSEVERLLADSSKAKQLLGWSSEITLEEGLKQTIEWFRENIHHYERNNYVI